MEKKLSTVKFSKEDKEIYTSALELLAPGVPFGLFSKLVDNYRSVNLYNRIMEFYHHMNCYVPKGKVENFRKKIEKSQNFRRRVGEILVELLDRLVTDSNIEILCNLYVNCAEDRISEPEFTRLAITLQKCTYSDIIELPNYRKTDDFEGMYEGSATDALISAGLLVNFTIGAEFTYQLNNLGSQMIKYGLNKEID